MSFPPLVWLDELVEPEELPAEFAFRIAVVREAKILAKVRGDADCLKDGEIDLVLEKPMGFHAELAAAVKARGVQPCARCRNPGGVPQDPDKSRRPCRIDGSRFGVKGGLCKRCYDSLLNRQLRETNGRKGGGSP